MMNTLGLHIRPAKQFTEIASKYKADVFIVRDNLRVNAKSIMGVIMLAAGQGAKLTLECSGEDEEQVCKELVALIENKFGED
jgi:phosphocarrier protein HPr